MAGVVPKANAIHAKAAQDKQLLNRAHRLLCHSPAPRHSWDPQATTCHEQQLTSGSYAASLGHMADRVMEGGVVQGSPRSGAVKGVLYT